MSITPITKDDLPALAQLYQQLIPNNFSLIKMEETLEKHQHNSSHLVLAAKIDGKLAGSLLAVTCDMLFGTCQSFMVIEDVVVDHKHRRKGVGQALIHHIEEYAKKNNCSYIMLITDTDRVESQQFYTSLGYTSDKYCAFKKQL